MAKFDYEYGELNEISHRSFQKSIDISDPFAAITDVTRDAMSIKPKIVGPFRGVVLRVDVEQIGFWRSMSSVLTGGAVGAAAWSCKIRVPELDSHLPPPDPSAPDSLPDTGGRTSPEYLKYSAVERHYTYFPRVKGMDQPEKGDIVWVDIINGQRFVIDTSRENQGSGNQPSGNPPPGNPPLPPAPPSETPTANSQSKPPTPQNVDESEAKKFIRRVNAAHGKIMIPVDQATQFVNFDILTKRLKSGTTEKDVTLLRQHFPRYEKFMEDFANAYEQIKGTKLYPNFNDTEGFRLVRKGGGAHFSKGSGSPHTKGTAIDILIPGKRDKNVTREQRTNFVLLLQKIAIENGYHGFGVGPGTIHMDYRSSPMYWVYTKLTDEEKSSYSGSKRNKAFQSAQDKKFTFSIYEQVNGRKIKSTFTKHIPIPKQWVDNPNDLKKIESEVQNWNYSSLRPEDIV